MMKSRIIQATNRLTAKCTELNPSTPSALYNVITYFSDDSAILFPCLTFPCMIDFRDYY